ncbi:hypothetical protein [Bradyrhizobium sp. th.b2]|uniref:hypothetical protein n=1 Tax=Bradyrhizobium sp. th-b2 TaxID=172088 RepID=UPI000421A70F|nr:hypothetical protein [Bradyrhizobium sp. th.b2]
MCATIDRTAQRVTEFLNLEAEVQTRRRKPTRQPVSMTGKGAVVRIRRRVRSSSLSGLSVVRALLATAD